MNRLALYLEKTRLLFLLMLTALIPSVIDNRIVVGAGPETKFLFFQFGVLLALMISLLLWMNERTFRVSIPSIVMLVMIGYMLIRAGVDSHPLYAFQYALQPISWLLFALLWASAMQSQKNWVPILSVVAIGQLFAITYAVVESFGVDIYFTYILGKPGQRWQNALVGEERVLIWTSLGNPNYFASYAGMLLCILIALIVLTRKPWAKALWGVYAVAVIYTLIFTYARGIWVSLSLMLVVLASLYMLMVVIPSLGWTAWLQRYRKLLFISGTACAILLGGLFVIEELRGGGPLHRVGERFYSAISLRDASMRARPLMWTGALRMWREAPIVGQGAGQYPVQYLESLYNVSQTIEQERIHRLTRQLNTIRADYAHNDYVQALAEWGMVGYTLLVLALLTPVVYGFWLLRRSSLSAPQRKLLIMAMAIILLSSAHSLFDFPIHLPASALMLALGIGFVLACLHQEQAREIRLPIWCIVPVVVLLFGAGLFTQGIIVNHLAASHIRTNSQSILAMLGGISSVSQQRTILESAQAGLERSLDLNPENGEALYNLGRTYWRLSPILSDRFDYKQLAKTYMDRALSTSGDPRMYMGLCRVNIDLFALQPARKQSDILLMIQPEERDVQYLAGLVRLKSNQWESALTFFQREVRRYPDHSEAWLQIAQIYQEHAGNPFAAVQAYEQCIQSRPGQVLIDVHAALAELYAEQLNNGDQALYHARLVLENAERAGITEWIEPIKIRIRDLERTFGNQTP